MSSSQAFKNISNVSTAVHRAPPGPGKPSRYSSLTGADYTWIGASQPPDSDRWSKVLEEAKDCQTGRNSVFTLDENEKLRCTYFGSGVVRLVPIQSDPAGRSAGTFPAWTGDDCAGRESRFDLGYENVKLFGLDLAVNASLYFGSLHESGTIGSTMASETVRMIYAGKMLSKLSALPDEAFHRMTRELESARGAPLADSDLTVVTSPETTLRRVSRDIAEEIIDGTAMNEGRLGELAKSLWQQVDGEEGGQGWHSLAWSSGEQTASAVLLRGIGRTGGTSTQTETLPVRIEFRPQDEYKPSEEDSAWPAKRIEEYGSQA